MELSVLFRVRSNMKSMATASVHTRGSMLTNSLWPPRSHIEKVISVFRMEIVFSMKLTPTGNKHIVSLIGQYISQGLYNWLFRTQCLDIVFVPASLHIFHHQTRLANLRVSNHPDLDHNTVPVRGGGGSGGRRRVLSLLL